MKFIISLCLIFLLSNSTSFAQLLLPPQDFNIKDFGAKPDGITLNTSAIQSAIDAANKIGGGRVLIPAGQFLSGSLFMKSDVELHLQENAVLLGSTNPDDYQRVKWWKALLLADAQKNFSITGKGTIDGQGRPLALNVDSLFYAGQLDSADYNFVEMRPKETMRPQLIGFLKCKNIEVKNVFLKNSSCWVQTYDQCDQLNIDSIKVFSDAYWNNDGIDISDCKNVRITNCDINAADDGICLKSHSVNHFCDSIYIANCTVRSSASAIKFGTKSMGGFKNVQIENIKVYDTFRSAIAIESVEGGFLENVLVENIEAKNTGNAIFIRLGHRRRHRTKSESTLKNVTIKNMKVEVAFERPDYEYDIRGPALPFFHNIFPSSITGIPGSSVENVRLENIEIIYPGRGNNGLANAPLSRLSEVPEEEAAYPEFSMFGELPAWGFYVRHVEGLFLKNITLQIQAADYRPALVFDEVKNLEMEGLKILGDEKKKPIILRRAEEVKVEDLEMVLKLK